MIYEHCTNSGFVCVRFLFNFETADEMDPVNGAEAMMLRGEHLDLSVLFNFGDEFTFD